MLLARTVLEREAPGDPGAFYDRHAEGYARRAAGGARARLLAGWAAGHAAPGLAVLDAGCGPGFAAAACARAGARVLGLDLSAGMVAVAEVRHAGAGARFIAADLRDFEYAGPAFGLLLLLDVAQHLPPGDLTLVLRRLGVLAAPGATLLVAWTTPERAPALARADYHPVHRVVHADEVLGAARRGGFERLGGVTVDGAVTRATLARPPAGRAPAEGAF